MNFRNPIHSLVLAAFLCGAPPALAQAPNSYEAGLKAYEAGKYELALENWNKAAEQGHAQAQTRLGLLYNNGQGAKTSTEQALKWYKKAANQGHSGAQFGLAQLYEKGNGVPQSDTQALAWYRKSAKQSHTYSQYALGRIYEKGTGVEPSYTQALDWYSKAALGGHEHARYKLGNLYYYGRGTPRSKSTAIDWYEKASASGSHKATLVLERLKGAPKSASAQSPTPDKSPSYIIPDDVAKSGAAVFDLVQEDGVFNEQNARDLMAIYLAVGKLSKNEKQTLLALSKSANAVVHYRSDVVAQRTVGALYIMNMIVRPKNLNEYWLKGDDGMRNLVNMASVAPVVDELVVNFIAGPFWEKWKESSLSNGYTPLRDIIGNVYGECEKLSQPQKQSCQQLAYKAMVAVDDHEADQIPDFIYNWVGKESLDFEGIRKTQLRKYK